MHGEIDLRPSGKILDIAVSTMLRTALYLSACFYSRVQLCIRAGSNRDCTRTLTGYLFPQMIWCTSSMCTLWFWGFSDIPTTRRISCDELSFTSVPFRQNLCGRCTG